MPEAARRCREVEMSGMEERRALETVRFRGVLPCRVIEAVEVAGGWGWRAAAAAAAARRGCSGCEMLHRSTALQGSRAASQALAPPRQYQAVSLPDSPARLSHRRALKDDSAKRTTPCRREVLESLEAALVAVVAVLGESKSVRLSLSHSTRTSKALHW